MTLKQILADPSISSWLKDAIKAAYEQDPIDALRDAHRLLKVLGERYTRVVNGTVTGGLENKTALNHSGDAVVKPVTVSLDPWEAHERRGR